MTVMRLFSGMREPALTLLCRRWGLSGLLLAMPVLAWGQQTTRINGTVKDPQGNPVAYAEVQILPYGLRTYVSGAGDFSLGPLADSVYALRVRRFGFTPKVVRVVMAGVNQPLHVVLEPLPVQLDTVQQIALQQDLPRVFERAQKGISVLKFGPELMKEYPGFPIDNIINFDSDFFNELRGAQCSRTVYLDGKEIASVSVDVVNHPEMVANEVDLHLREKIRMRDIAAVEAIRVGVLGIHEPDFTSYEGAGGCGHIIMIWTKGFQQKPYKGP